MACSEQKDSAGQVNLARSTVEKELAGEACNDLGEAAGQHGFARLVQYLIFFGCLLFAGYHCLTTILGMPVAYVHRPIHVMFAASLAFLVYPSSKKRGPTPLDLVLALVALAAFALPAIQADQIAERLVMVDDLTLGQTISGITALLLVLVLIQRVVGMSLLVVCLLFLAYAFWGAHIPGMLAHKGFSWNEVVD